VPKTVITIEDTEAGNLSVRVKLSPQELDFSALTLAQQFGLKVMAMVKELNLNASAPAEKPGGS
jgi:hypothetical protein